MGSKTKKVVKKKPSEPKKVLINVKILQTEKALLEAKARHYSKGNVTKLIRLLAYGKFIPSKAPKKKAA